ncbi:MAG: SDR family oxidoreductase [Candidatus Lambdaproteobacteria bacterium]|nr:SDR family oxidoreductase [Candidatus Lambdaproteobacteria bacterium]
MSEQFPQRFAGQVALITGAAQGIGLGIARRLGAEGARVVLLDRSAGQLQTAAQTLAAQGIAQHTLSVDVTLRDAVEAAIGSVARQWSRIDVLVTAAGITGKTNLKTHEVDPGDFDRVLDVNLRGMFFCIRAVLPHMLAAGYGRIVNIASISGKDGNAGMLAYSTSKAAVIGMTKVVGKEYAGTGITCNAVAPAVVRTALVDAMPPEQVRYMTDKIPMGRTGEIEEVAAVVAFAASREAGFTTGFCFDASGGRAVY